MKFVEHINFFKGTKPLDFISPVIFNLVPQIFYISKTPKTKPCNTYYARCNVTLQLYASFMGI